jgi:hypothetical protein
MVGAPSHRERKRPIARPNRFGHPRAYCKAKQREAIVKSKLTALLFLAAGAMFAQVSVGIRIGAPPAMRVERVQPRSPGGDYTWIAGYWYPVGNHYKWHDGYWTRPAYSGAHWVEPRHDGERYYEGRWEGDKGPMNHNHRWDKEKNHNRDYNRHDQ